MRRQMPPTTSNDEVSRLIGLTVVLIEQDLKDVVALQVTGTPEFFINGRPLAAASFDELKSAIDRALRDAYR